jgi:peptidoglycan/xylan/chitin deacetylase (PgdA/CDA1 family)
VAWGASTLLVLVAAISAGRGAANAPFPAAVVQAHASNTLTPPPPPEHGGLPISPRREWNAYPPQVPPAFIPAGRGVIRLPILMYHYIRVNPNPVDRVGADLSVTPGDFNAELDWLRDQGYHPVDFNYLRAYLAGQENLPAKPVIMTFDDGYADFFTTAYPMLSAHGFKAVSYVVPGFFGRNGYMNQDQVLQLDRSGIQVASHTWSHADLSNIDPAGLAHEVVDSRNFLQGLLGHPVVDFCYPYGRFNDAAVHAVDQAGYATATTTQGGSSHSVDDRYLWTRVRVHGGESLDNFAASLGDEESAVVPPRPGDAASPPIDEPTVPMPSSPEYDGTWIPDPVLLPLLRPGPRGQPATQGW